MCNLIKNQVYYYKKQVLLYDSKKNCILTKKII